MADLFDDDEFLGAESGEGDHDFMNDMLGGGNGSSSSSSSSSAAAGNNDALALNGADGNANMSLVPFGEQLSKNKGMVELPQECKILLQNVVASVNLTQ